ncbi:unnamed protein product [Trichobilharzia regenti]|nr:unnamed protein product [Trichobilharzia regenti]
MEEFLQLSLFYVKFYQVYQMLYVKHVLVVSWIQHGHVENEICTIN